MDEITSAALAELKRATAENARVKAELDVNLCRFEELFYSFGCNFSTPEIILIYHPNSGYKEGS